MTIKGHSRLRFPGFPAGMTAQQPVWGERGRIGGSQPAGSWPEAFSKTVPERTVKSLKGLRGLVLCSSTFGSSQLLKTLVQTNLTKTDKT